MGALRSGVFAIATFENTRFQEIVNLYGLSSEMEETSSCDIVYKIYVSSTNRREYLAGIIYGLDLALRVETLYEGGSGYFRGTYLLGFGGFSRK